MSRLETGGLKSFDELLAPVPGLWDRLRWLAGGPVPGSAAASDSVTELGQQSWVFGHLGASVAIDHLESWRAMRTGPKPIQPTFAHLTLLRGSIESAVMTRYLADPESDQAERFARGAGVYRADLEERRKFEKRRPDMIEPVRGKPATARLDKLAKELKKREVRAKEPPAVTTLCARYIDTVTLGDGEFIYRLLSAFAHGKQWPVLPGSAYEEFGPAAGLTRATLTRITANPRVAAELTVVAVETTSSAIAGLERYGGKPPSP